MTPGLCSISRLDMHSWTSLGGIPGAILKCVPLCEVDKEVYMDDFDRGSESTSYVHFRLIYPHLKQLDDI